VSPYGSFKHYSNNSIGKCSFNTNGTVLPKQARIGDGRTTQHEDYKQAGPSICVPSFLSPGVSPVKKMLSVELIDYWALVLKTVTGCVNQKSQHVQEDCSDRGTDLQNKISSVN
jgi:hypothetical protein